MDNEVLIKIVEDLLNSIDGTFDYKIYDVLKMDSTEVDTKKINGIAEVTNGMFEPIKGLSDSSVEMSIDFVFPVERLEEVKRVFTEASKQSVGLILNNSEIVAGYTGSTEILITYPTQGVYNADTMGENITAQLVVYFDINENSVFSNSVTIAIQGERYDEDDEVTSTTTGTYYTRSGTAPDYVYTAVTLPSEYVAETTYYEKVLFWENIPYHKQVITRTINNSTNNFANNTEKKVINIGQALNISLVVSSQKGSIINKIKKDKLLGLNIKKSYNLKLTDEDGEFTFNNMVVSGNFTYNLEPRSVAFFQITFVYGKVKECK